MQAEKTGNVLYEYINAMCNLTNRFLESCENCFKIVKSSCFTSKYY